MLKTLFSEDCIRVGEKYYFSCVNLNCIYSLNIITHRIELESFIPGEDIFMHRLSSKILYWNDSLIFIPMNAKALWLWRINENLWESIDVQTMGVEENKFFNAVIYENRLYMFGCAVPGIVKVNLQNYDTDIVERPFRKMAKLKNNNASVCFRCDYVKKDNCFYMASCLDNSIMKFCADTEKVDLIKVGSKDNRYSGISFDGEDFWISTKSSGCILRWNEDNCDVQEIKIPKEEAEPDTVYGGISIMPGSKFLLYARKGKSIVFQNSVNGVAFINDGETYIFAKNFENESRLLNDKGELKIISATGEEKINLRVSEQCLKKFISKYVDLSSRIYNENSLFELKDFLSILGGQSGRT